MHVATITIDHTKVAGDLTDYVVAVVNNGDVGWAELYATATAGGGDIRVYKSGGVTELPREIVSFSVSLETGEIHIMYTGTLSGSVDTDIEIHADGTSADYAVTATYGRNAVWSDYILVTHMFDNTTATIINAVDGSTLSKSSANNPIESSVSKVGETSQLFSSDTINITDLIGLSPAAVTYSAWVRTNSNGTDQRAVAFTNGSNGGSQHFIIWVNRSSADMLSTYWRFSGGTNEPQTTSYTTLDTWNKVTATADPNGDMRSYANGSRFDLTSVGTFLGASINGQYIGAARTGSAAYFSGNVDEVRISLQKISDEWETTEYNNQNSPTTFYSVAAASGNVTVTPTAQTATFSLPAETVSTGTTVAANTQTAIFSLPAESVIIATTATPDAQVATFSIPNFTIDAGGNVTVVGGINSATFSLPQESILFDFVTQPSAVTATFSTPATTIATGSGATVAPAAQVGTFSTPAPSISVEASVTVGVDTQLLTFSLPALQRVGGVWTKRPRATNADWSRRSVNDD